MAYFSSKRGHLKAKRRKIANARAKKRAAQLAKKK
ncbi:MAG: hypothetical protein HPKKFMNG_00428 [Planctomycetes bacterium]|nr:hypothetical protein [Planctomycetota bacterium]